MCVCVKQLFKLRYILNHTTIIGLYFKKKRILQPIVVRYNLLVVHRRVLYEAIKSNLYCPLVKTIIFPITNFV